MEYCAKPSVSDAECLLSKADNIMDTVSRRSCKLTDFCDRFRLKDRNFIRQYAHLYSERLVTLRRKLENAAKEKWGMSF